MARNFFNVVQQPLPVDPGISYYFVQNVENLKFVRSALLPGFIPYGSGLQKVHTIYFGVHEL